MAEKTCDLEQENPQDDSKQAKKLLEQERRRQTPTALETRGEHRDTAAERIGKHSATQFAARTHVQDPDARPRPLVRVP